MGSVPFFVSDLSFRHPGVSESAQHPFFPLTCICMLGAQQSDSVGLVVISEEDTHRTLLIHRIVCEDIYFRQGGELCPRSLRFAASFVQLKRQKHILHNIAAE